MIPDVTESSLPVNVKVAAKLGGIHQVTEVEALGVDGLLSITSSGKYVATLCKDQSETRKRFTLAHELGHLMIYRSLHDQRVGAERDLQCRAGSPEAQDEERLADVLAAHLLMPRTQFLAQMDAIGICAGTLPALARRFAVSLNAASRRVVELLPYNVGIGLWSLAAANTYLAPKWFVSRRSMAKPQHAIALSSPGSDCFVEDSVRGWRWIPIQGRMDKYFVDVAPLRGSTARLWLVLVIFESAAEHIAASLAHVSMPGVQSPLIDD
jgi:hypothetical protein